MLGRGAAPGPGAQKSCRGVRKAPSSAAERGLEQLCGEHCTLPLISQLKLPARTKRILGVGITGIGRELLEQAVGVPSEELLSLLLKEAGYYVGHTLHSWCVSYIIYVLL